MNLIIGYLSLFSIAGCFAGKLQESFIDGNIERIIGGHEAKPHSRPFQVLILRDGQLSCGGSILNKNTVLTAGHCCETEENNVKVVVGDHDKTRDEGCEQTRSVKTIITHPKYDSTTLSHDSCILKLNKAVEFNEYVSPAKLPKPNQEFTGNSIVSGWGQTNSGEEADKLQVVETPVVDDETCLNFQVGLVKYEKSNMICAGQEDKGSCHGDSGGPLTCGDDDTLCGIVSWGDSSCHGVSVYGSVVKMLDFIECNM